MGELRIEKAEAETFPCQSLALRGLKRPQTPWGDLVLPPARAKLPGHIQPPTGSLSDPPSTLGLRLRTTTRSPSSTSLFVYSI